MADPNVVMFYNKHQEYRRGRISDAGDRCDWFAFDSATVLESVARFDPTVRERPHRPFPWTHGFAGSSVYLFQHAMVRYATHATCHEDLAIEENASALLDCVITDAYRIRGQRPRPRRRSTVKLHAETVADAQAVLANRYAEKLTLTQIAEQLDVSPYHLSRLFRQQTGFAVHHYLMQLRIRAALDALSGGAIDLTRLALDIGFSSHSHFSQICRQTLGLTPAELRGQLTRPRFQQISKNLIAACRSPHRIRCEGGKR